MRLGFWQVARFVLCIAQFQVYGILWFIGLLFIDVVVECME